MNWNETPTHCYSHFYHSSHVPLRVVTLIWYTDDILGAALPASCSLLFYGKETQPMFTIAAGCPGKDLVRLWPLPVQSPWFEDWWEHKFVDSEANL